MLEQFPEFLSNHSMLAAAWVAIAGALSWTLMQTARGSARLSPAEVTRMINSEDAFILDVRTSAEFEQGHILNAENVALDDLPNQIKQLEKHRSRPVIVTCRIGQQSANAAKILGKAGFERVFNLAGGVAAWQDASLPLSKKK